MVEQSILQELRERTTFLDVTEVAELLQINRSTVYSHVRANIITAIRLGDLLRFDPTALADALGKLLTNKPTINMQSASKEIK